MLRRHRHARLAGLIPLACFCTAAYADGAIPLNITNDGTQDILVTVYDLNTQPASVVVSNTRINSFTRLPVAVTPDAQGRANLSWTAVSADPDSRLCGHAQQLGVRDSASVHVRANSPCPP